MKTSCIQSPNDNRYIQVFDWQVKFCQGNHCTAFVLAHFIAWHDWKLQHDLYYKRANDIAEAHGDNRLYDQNAYLFFTMDELSDGILGSYGRNSIQNALETLEKMGVISIHKNPNRRYCFDKTKYFIFYPEVCNAWIKRSQVSQARFPDLVQNNEENQDPLILNDREFKIKQPSVENKQPSFKKGQAITDTTNNTTNKDQSINQGVPAFVQSIPETLKPIVKALVEVGFSPKRFKHADSIQTLECLQKAGADLDMFLIAYEKASVATESNSFGINYLAKVVESLLEKRKQGVEVKKHQATKTPSTIFENDIPDNLDWLEGV